mmetsp:Transcript_17165/g.21704  ORF Transcript_17165/g.21704 Transcript_17165/m.21704 type:complete len:316 (+) Transcript_17165:53-1000(+)
MIHKLQRAGAAFRSSTRYTFGNRAQRGKLVNAGKNSNNTNIGTRRYKSTGNKNGGTDKDSKVLNRPAPDININPAEGNTVLHQKAAKAAELHAELNALLDKQAKRRTEELNRPFGAGFLEFIKKSKSEIINITAAFACVLLAWQVSNIRKGAKKLLEEAEQKELRMEKLKKILRALSNEEFSDRVVRAYEERLLSNSKVNEVEKSLKNWFLTKRIKEETKDQQCKSGNDLLLKDVLQSELQKTIGDVALTAYELEERRLKVLQKEMGIEGMKSSESKSNDSPDLSLGGLEQILEEAQQGSDPDSGKKVVKRKGFI